MKKQLSAIIPAYNEEERILDTLSEVAAYLSAKDYEFEIIVVDDGSTDKTAQMVVSLNGQYPQIRFFQNARNLGKGATVKAGIVRAVYPYCLFMDADNSTSIVEWEKFEKFFEAGAPIVIASRHLAGSTIVNPQPWPRRFLGGGYRM